MIDRHIHKNTNMQTTRPDVLISYVAPINEAALHPLIEALSVPGLNLTVRHRRSLGPFAGVQLLLPTAVLIWFGKSYFESFLKEAGKDHYAKVKGGLSSLWSLFFGENAALRFTAFGSSGKLESNQQSYSVSISIGADAHSGLQFKLLFRDSVSAQHFNAGTGNFLDFLSRYYRNELDVETESRLNSVRALGRTILLEYDPDGDFFRFIDPVPTKGAAAPDPKSR
jgi:hypothetical protein